MSEFHPPARRQYQVRASVREEVKKKQEVKADLSYKPWNFDVRIPLQSLAEEGRLLLFPKISRVTVGMATCGRAAGALAIQQSLSARQDGPDAANVVSVGCLGACYAEPLVDVRMPDGRHYFYGRADQRSLWSIISKSQGKPPSHHLWAVAKERKNGVLSSIHDMELVNAYDSGFKEFFDFQTRRISGRCGLINPQDIKEYAAAGGYQALERSLFRCRPEKIIELIKASGLRGRGGAGFLTGVKWDITASAKDLIRFVVANADEGDPGAYMDRALLESDPHSVLEGLIIAAYAVGASQAYIFVRHEYPLAVHTLREAIKSARRVGILGPN